MDRSVLLSYSDDDGHTWSDWSEVALAGVGEHQKRVQFNRLGSFVSRAWRVRMSSPIKTDLIGGQVNFRQTTR